MGFCVEPGVLQQLHKAYISVGKVQQLTGRIWLTGLDIDLKAAFRFQDVKIISELVCTSSIKGSQTGFLSQWTLSNNHLEFLPLAATLSIQVSGCCFKGLLVLFKCDAIPKCDAILKAAYNISDVLAQFKRKNACLLLMCFAVDQKIKEPLISGWGR